MKLFKQNINAATQAVQGAADVSNMQIIVQSHAYVDIHEDDYEHGEGKYVNQWTFDVSGTYDSIQDLIDAIADTSYVFSRDINDYIFMDGALQTSASVNEDNYIPTDEEFEDFKRGELTLYIADMYLSLYVTSGIHEMTADEAEAFGIVEVY